MKTYESKISGRNKCCVWAMVVYCSLGIIMCTLLYHLSGNDDETIVPFVSAIVFMGVFACIKISKTTYSITDEYLNIRDFKYTKINIHQIKSVTVLKRKVWTSVKMPYNVVIEEINGRKTYLSPESINDMLSILKETNGDIAFYNA